jgi:hypothetical protein
MMATGRKLCLYSNPQYINLWGATMQPNTAIEAALYLFCTSVAIDTLYLVGKENNKERTSKKG